MKKLSMLVAAAFALVSFGAVAAPKAAESSSGTVVSAATSTPAPKAATQKSTAKKSGKKTAKKK